MPGPWEDFQDRPSDIRVTVRPNAQAAAPTGVPWEDYAQPSQKQQPTVTEDILKTIPAGLARGAIATATMPREIIDTVSGWLEKAGMHPDAIKGVRTALSVINPMGDLAPTNDELKKQVEQNVTGELYTPKTTPGKYANTISEFVPGSLGPGGPLKNFIKFAAIPGLVSEGAGQLTQGTAAEPWARAIGAVVPATAASLLTRPSVAGAVNQYTHGANPQHIQRAEALFAEAQQLGMPISRAEALQAVTNGATGIADLQRVLEGQGAMKQFFAPRPQQNAQAFTNTINDVQPMPTQRPSTIGPAAAETSGEIIGDVRAAINQATEPYYQAAAQAYLSPADMTKIRRTVPGFDEAAAAVRNNPQLNRYVQHLPDNSVGFLNEVKKYLDQAGTNAAGPMNAQRNQQVAAGYTLDAQTVKQAAIDATGGVGGVYDVALQAQAQARRQYLDPLLQGPLGRLAKEDLPTQKAISALFPTNPLPNSAAEISEAVQALAHRRPQVARDLVRAHLESTFNEATQNLIGGQNQFGGAKFAATIRGNEQQAANLEAAIRALPDGDRIWNGVDRFLTILEAQGTRQRPGSMTSFNNELLQDLRGGTTPGAIAKNTLSFTQIPKNIADKWERWRLGQNTAELARLLTDPRAAREFQRLASAPAAQQIPLLSRLTFLSATAPNKSAPPKR